jgi:hypothetical protein
MKPFCFIIKLIVPAKKFPADQAGKGAGIYTDYVNPIYSATVENPPNKSQLGSAIELP